MHKAGRTSTSSSTTYVDPKGLSKLYLPTTEIQSFFEAQEKYYAHHIKKQSSKRFYWLMGILTIGIAVGIALIDEFGFGDDEGVIVIFWGIGVIIALFIAAAIFGGGIDSLKLNQSKGYMLSAFFDAIADDLHPESGLKGTLNHASHNNKHVYKRKTSPYSGAKKVYYKYPWASLKFMLIDGTSLRLKCVDKLKEKGSSIVRFQEIGKTKLAPNTLIYDLLPGQTLNNRTDLCTTQNDLLKHATSHGESLAESLKKTYVNKLKRREEPLKPAQQKAEKAVVGPVKKVHQLLLGSELKNLEIQSLGKDTLELRHIKNDAQYVLWIDVRTTEGEAYVGIRLPVMGDAPENLRLLKANPALAYGRFAYTQQASGRKQLCLFKTLLYSTLDREELETAIHGLCELSHHLSHEKHMPEKTKAYREAREPDWENALIKNALEPLDLAEAVEVLGNKAKIKLILPSGRKQTVHVRFDRQDLQGNQLISILSYCGADSPEMYDIALEENSKYSYGALGLDHLGNAPMFVVCDHQLAQTADPPEITHAVLQIAQKADQMEELLTGADVH